jgi:hypothetical protein
MSMDEIRENAWRAENQHLRAQKALHEAVFRIIDRALVEFGKRDPPAVEVIKRIRWIIRANQIEI